LSLKRSLFITLSVIGFYSTKYPDGGSGASQDGVNANSPLK
jgi:hypothetical protein